MPAAKLAEAFHRLHALVVTHVCEATRRSAWLEEISYLRSTDGIAYDRELEVEVDRLKVATGRRAGRPRVRRAQGSNTPIAPTKGLRYEGVAFQFLSPGGADGIDDTLTGTVLIREGSMILDLSEQPAGLPCLIEGREANHVYGGHNTLRHVDPRRVDARWSDLGGGTYVGTWGDEDGDNLLRSACPSQGAGDDHPHGRRRGTGRGESRSESVSPRALRHPDAPAWGRRGRSPGRAGAMPASHDHIILAKARRVRGGRSRHEVCRTRRATRSVCHAGCHAENDCWWRTLTACAGRRGR